MSVIACCLTLAARLERCTGLSISAETLPSVGSLQGVSPSNLSDHALLARAELVQPNKIDRAASVSKPADRAFMSRGGRGRGHVQRSVHQAPLNRFRFEVFTLLISGNLLLHGQGAKNGLLGLPFYGDLGGILELSAVSVRADLLASGLFLSCGWNQSGRTRAR